MMEKLIVRIPKKIYDHILWDLKTPHPFAWERVGFMLSTHKSYEDGTTIVFLKEYIHLEDKHYVKDNSVGAKINSKAIQLAMQWVLDGKGGIVHVHHHLGSSRKPSFSDVDVDDGSKLIESIRNINSERVHGLFLLNDTGLEGLFWLPGLKEPVYAEKIVVVGYPMKFSFAEPLRMDEEDEMYSRQSFLGENSQPLIRRVRIGIVGLGGGGSHVVQQLSHIGFLNYSNFDSDHVERSNLNRLVGATLSDSKNKIKKVYVVERLIKSLLPNAIVNSIPDNWQTKPELLQQCDIVFGCIDTLLGRRDLELECRRYLIPLIDIGMDIFKVKGQPPRMAGQVFLSLPGNACTKCMKVIQDEDLKKEAAQYGEIGGRPQVVWPNGILASSAVGIAVDLVTGWTKESDRIFYLSFDGNNLLVSNHLYTQFYSTTECVHFKFSELGPPVFKRV